jgi:hypothetical protein
MKIRPTIAVIWFLTLISSLLGHYLSPEHLPKDLTLHLSDYLPGKSVPPLKVGCFTYYDPPRDYGYVVTCTLDDAYFKSVTVVVSYETDLISNAMFVCNGGISVETGSPRSSMAARLLNTRGQYHSPF